MSIASGITALVTALQTALNNRASVGASDYQMWLAQGNTGDMTAYRTSILGGDVDYATQFNNQLGTQPTAGTATETQTGVTQFATAAEVLAGTNALKAVSAKNLRSTIGIAAIAYATGAQNVAASTLTALATQNVVSDPAAMGPTSADWTKWTLPWVGKYRFTIQLALTQSVPAGSYAGITINLASGASVGDNGLRSLWQAGDVQRFASDFWNPTAGQTAIALIYAQLAAAATTTNAGGWNSSDAKAMRITLEYLGA